MAALALVTLTACGVAQPTGRPGDPSRPSHDPPAVGSGSAGLDAAPSASAQPTQAVALPTSPPWLVGAPALQYPSGPGIPDAPTCSAAQVTATATTRPIVGGVAGVISLKASGCGLHITHGPTALLSRTGKSLGVRLDSTQPKVNPPLDPRSDWPLLTGDAVWGFTWTGSWCGVAAAQVLLPMTGDPHDPADEEDHGTLRIPLTGPQPSCSGRSTSVLRIGIPGRAEEGVLPAPPEWSELRGAVSLPDVLHGTLPPYELTLSNPTAQAIWLSPCPQVGVLLAVRNSVGHDPSASDTFGGQTLSCPVPPVVPAHGSVHVTLQGWDFDQGIEQPYHPGSVVTVEVAVAGMATAKAVAHVG